MSTPRSPSDVRPVPRTSRTCDNTAPDCILWRPTHGPQAPPPGFVRAVQYVNVIPKNPLYSVSLVYRSLNPCPGTRAAAPPVRMTLLLRKGRYWTPRL